MVRSPPAVFRLHDHRVDAQPAAGPDDGAAGVDLDAEPARFVDQRPGRVVAQIDDGSDADARLLQVDRGRIGAVVGGVDADIPADGDAVMVEVGACGRGQHHARPVVVGEHHVAFDRAGGQHDAPGAHLPQPLARHIGAGALQMIADALVEPDEVLRIVAERRGPRQDRDIVHGLQLRHRALRPGPTVLAIDHSARFEAQRAAEFGLLVGDDDAHAGFGSSQRRGQAACTAAKHQHFAMGVTGRIMIRVGPVGRHAEAGGGTDLGLVQRLPRSLRPHEGLVVETGGEERRGEVVDRADVEGQRRPAVLRTRFQPLIQLLHGGAHVRRLAGRVPLDLDERVGLLGAGRQNAARPVILERAADQVDAVGQQRRGQRIALQADIGLVVEGEARRLRLVDAAGIGNTERRGHFAAPGSLEGFGSPAL